MTKIILAAIIAFVTIGASMALKTKNFGTAAYYTCNGADFKCEIPVNSGTCVLSPVKSASFPTKIVNATLLEGKDCFATENCGTLYGALCQ